MHNNNCIDINTLTTSIRCVRVVIAVWGVSAMMGRGDKWWGAVVAVAVCCALFGVCSGNYEPRSILCDDIDAICAENGFEVSTDCLVFIVSPS